MFQNHEILEYLNHQYSTYWQDFVPAISLLLVLCPFHQHHCNAPALFIVNSLESCQGSRTEAKDVGAARYSDTWKSRVSI